MATIYDIARVAKVSTATVSHAFNRPYRVKAETRERIFEAARELEYHPSPSAQALAKGKSSIVGLLVSDIRVPHAANVARGVEDKLIDAGFLPMIVSTDGDSHRIIMLLDKLISYGACGFILLPSQYGVPQTVQSELEAAQKSGTPIVVTGHDLKTDHINYVSMRGQEAARDLTRHFLELGHRDIGLVGHRFSSGMAIHRWLGYQEAMLEYGVKIRAELIAETEPTATDSLESMERLMALSEPPTAIVAMSDVYARGVVDFVHKYRLSVPEQLSIGTYDYEISSTVPTPRLTSIVRSAYNLGSKSAEMFIELQQDPSAGPRRTFVDYKLEIRETSAPPPSR